MYIPKQLNVIIHQKSQQIKKKQPKIRYSAGLTSYTYNICNLVQGSMVYWLALWTLNPAIRVQISVEPN